MGISILDNFDYRAGKPNFTRDLFATVEEMVAFPEMYLPSVFECNVTDTGDRYRYNVNNDVDPVTGKWRLVTGGTGGSVDGYTKGEVNTLLNKKLDKPETEGTVGQVLTVQEDGTNAYADVPTYDDTEVKNDIVSLKEYKQNEKDNTLTTTDKTITGAINEVNGNLLDTVGFSADYKNIILNRKNGLNPYTIPISAIINNASLAELKDIDSTDVGDGKTLVYDGTTNKHKYVDSLITDEFVKMDSTTDANYLSNLIDKSTVVNDNGVLKVKKLDGQEVTITEINYLKGLTMNIMDLVNAFSNGGVKVLNTPLNTASELDTMDRTSFTDGISYIVYVLADETHSNAKTTYLCTKTSTTFFGNADSQRNFITNPIDLANEVTGKLDNSHIDIDSLWTLLTINDTYKTLTTNNEIFGTHGAKAMYDELATAIGGKANATDLTTHTGNANIHVTTTDKAKWDKVIDKVDTVGFNTHKDNTDIHITNAERTKWDKVDNKINKTDITTTIDSSSTDDEVPSAKAVNDILSTITGITNTKIYYLLSQLGITTPCTIKDIWDKMPSGSIAIVNADSSTITDLDVIKIALGLSGGDEVYGILTVVKLNGRTTLEFRRARTGKSMIPDTFIGYCKGDDCTSISWKRIAFTTGVADVGVTTITPVNSNITGTIEYTVKNGICYVSMKDLMSTISSTGLLISTTMPKPSVNCNCSVSSLSSSGNIAMIYIDKNTAKLNGDFYVNNAKGRCSFSYPVAE